VKGDRRKVAATYHPLALCNAGIDWPESDRVPGGAWLQDRSVTPRHREEGRATLNRASA
jgi:hypothetical protein